MLCFTLKVNQMNLAPFIEDLHHLFNQDLKDFPFEDIKISLFNNAFQPHLKLDYLCLPIALTKKPK